MEEPLKEKVSDWLNASKEAPDYDELKRATQNLLVESFAQRTSLDNRDINVPDSVRDRARDVLSLLSDAMVNRLIELRENADLTQEKMLRELIKEIRILRENTTTERKAKEAADQGLAEFWSSSKDEILDPRTPQPRQSVSKFRRLNLQKGGGVRVLAFCLHGPGHSPYHGGGKDLNLSLLPAYLGQSCQTVSLS